MPTPIYSFTGAFSGHKKIPHYNSRGHCLIQHLDMACLFWNSWFQNNINVLGQSPVFNELTAGRAPQVVYNVNGHDYNMGYYLANGIYPKWDTSVKTFPKPNNERKKKGSPSTKRRTIKTLNVVLVYCKLDLASFEGLLEGGIWLPFELS